MRALVLAAVALAAPAPAAFSEDATAIFVDLCLGTAEAPLERFRAAAEGEGFAVDALGTEAAGRVAAALLPEAETPAAEGWRAVREDEDRAVSAYVVDAEAAGASARSCFVNGFVPEDEALAPATVELRLDEAIAARLPDAGFEAGLGADVGEEGAIYTWEAAEPPRTVALRRVVRDGRAYVAAEYAARPAGSGR